jgi:hypothetical protein
VPQPTTLPRAPTYKQKKEFLNNKQKFGMERANSSKFRVNNLCGTWLRDYMVDLESDLDVVAKR